MIRSSYIDYIKALAILLVITYHCHYYDGILGFSVFLSMCCPLFFAVNGILLLNKARTYDYYLPKMFKILFLILFWGILSNLFSAFLYAGEYSMKSCIADLFYLRNGYCNHLWFMCTLFILYSIYPLLSIVTNERKTLITFGIIISCLTLYGISSVFSNINPIKGWHSYALAYALCALIIQKIDIRNIVLPLLIFLISMGGGIIFNHFIYVDSVAYSDIIFKGYNSPFIFVGTLSLIKFVSMLNLKPYRLITFISRNSLGIYLLHIFMTKYIHFQQYTSTVRFLLPILVLGLSCFACFILNKNKYTRKLISL